MEKNIYEKIFDISNDNMQKSGNSFVHSKSAFMCYAELDPHKVDLIELFKVKMSNPEFLDIAYINLLNRPVDPEAYQSWKKHFNMPEQQFRRLVIKRLATSKEANVCHKRIYNNIFVKQKNKPQKDTLRSKAMQKLMPVYKKLPESIKAPIRRIVGGNQS